MQKYMAVHVLYLDNIPYLHVQLERRCMSNMSRVLDFYALVFGLTEGIWRTTFTYTTTPPSY